jgi:accessory secretory protein Asp1
MIHFIPAWYRQDQWCENEQFWYARRMHTEFDDSVKHIQLFHRSGSYPYCILLLVYMPNLRHFLHRQGLYHAPYWSCFDAMQEIRVRKHRVFSFHDIKWPKGVAFIYTPFAVVVQQEGKKFAQIEFGEDGNLIQIDMFEEGQLVRRNLYDDRGFVSGSIVYEEGHPVYQDYLMENGIWKFRCYEEDGHVEINPNSPTYLLMQEETEVIKNYHKSRYDNLEELIAEVFGEYIRHTKEQDIFCMAVHARHVHLVQDALKNRKLILSFFEDRYDLAADPTAAELIAAAHHIITDAQENTAEVLRLAGDQPIRVSQITPYDSRVDFGISRQIPVQKILVPVDDLETEIFKDLMGQLCRYLGTNRRARVYLFTRQANYSRKTDLEKQVRSWLGTWGYDQRWCMEEAPEAVQENAVDQEDPVRRLFFVEQCVDELSVSRCMREQRIMVDLRDVPELYLQITAISMGIPQIVRRQTAFVRDGKNGFILKDMQCLPECLSYFLDSLGNWNEALVYSYELGKNFTTEKLLEKWKEVIDCVG